MLNILYSFNKAGEEAAYWKREISEARTSEYQFIPFNHGDYINPSRYLRAQDLDALYYSENNELVNLYVALTNIIQDNQITVLLVDNANPYHPEFLRRLSIFKVLRSSDCALITYEREIPYLHAFNYVLYYTHGYSQHVSMAEKFAYCGANADMLPLGAFSEIYDKSQTVNTILSKERDIDIIYIGSLHPLKMPVLGLLKRKYGARFVIKGLSNLKRNVYFNLRHAFPTWITPIAISEYKNYYQRAKIGLNFHIRDWRQAGNYRLYDLPANGVMQISDGGKYLNKIYEINKEVVTYKEDNELIQLIDYYLENDNERKEIALAGFQRTHRDYLINKVLLNAASLIQRKIREIGM